MEQTLHATVPIHILAQLVPQLIALKVTVALMVTVSSVIIVQYVSAPLGTVVVSVSLMMKFVILVLAMDVVIVLKVRDSVTRVAVSWAFLVPIVKMIPTSVKSLLLVSMVPVLMVWVWPIHAYVIQGFMAATVVWMEYSVMRHIA